ncbi:MAG: class I SAM-dependent methyltransferase [Chloroflexota bacterium]
MMKLFDDLQQITSKPKPFDYYTTPQLWNDPHISKGMLKAHLDPTRNAASYRTDIISKAVDWMSAHFGISHQTTLCDFGCGPGLYTTQFAKKGAAVTGIDLSERSITYAKELAAREGLVIGYILQNYLQFSPDQTYDLITMISRDFPVLSPKQRSTLLTIFHEALDDKGAILLDVDSIERFEAATEQTRYEVLADGGFWSAEPHYIFESTFKYEGEKVLLEKYTIVEEDRQREIFNWHQCYSLQTLTALFAEHKLHIEEAYSNVAGEPYNDDSPVIAVVARKSTA